MSEERLHEYYRYCQEYFFDLQGREFDEWFLKYYRFLRGGRKKGSVLDVGCGVGQVVTRLAEDGLESIGIDVSPIAIKLAARSTKKNPHASFIVASVYQLPFKKDTFDAAGCLDVLEHLQDPEACLDEMLRVVREEGNIIISSPNFLWPIPIFGPVYFKGLKPKLLNTKKILSRMIKPPEKPSFEHVKPKLDWSGKTVGHDLDAITITDPITIKCLLKRKGVKVVYQSCYHGGVGLKSIFIEKLSTVPFIRNMGGGIFIMGKLVKKNMLRQKYS